MRKGGDQVLVKPLWKAWRVWRSPQTPLWLKLLPLGALLYVLWPLDLLPDILPGLGWIDDVLMLLVPIVLLLWSDRKSGTPASSSGTGNGGKVVEGRAFVMDEDLASAKGSRKDGTH